MGSTVTTKAPELEHAVLTTLLRLKQDCGYVSNADVQRAAITLECSTRRIRRMLERGYVRASRETWQPEGDLTARLVQHNGSVAQLHEALCKEGEDPGVGVRTMQRWFATHYDQRVLTGARHGYAAMYSRLGTLERHTESRNDEWAIDHTQLPVWVRLADGDVVKPWMTTVLDAATRMVMGFTVSPYTPTTEESVETVALAAEGYTTEDGVFVGGQPQMLHSDRGSDLVTRAMTLGLIEQGTGRSFSEAYTPQQNGRIERWHRTIKSEYLPQMPGYDRTGYSPHDPRRAPRPVLEPHGLLPLEAFQQQMLKALSDYNFDRSHRSLDGRTPFEAWSADPAPIQKADPQAIRASMTQQIERVVSRGRIQWDGRYYQVPGDRVAEGLDPDTGEVLTGQRWRAIVEGQQVLVRYLPTRIEFVEVYTTSGQYIGRAHWTKYLDAAEAAQAVADRREAIRTMRTAVEDIAATNAAAVQALVQSASAEQPSEDDALFGARPSTANGRRPGTPSTGSTARQAASRQQERSRVALLNNVVQDRTGTDNLNF